MKTRVKARDKIELLIDDEAWAEARVIDPLSSQFTCVIKGQPKVTRFFFYADEGLTWRRVK